MGCADVMPGMASSRILGSFCRTEEISGYLQGVAD
jgi:hypothetical protein